MNRSYSRFLSEPTSTTQLSRPSFTAKGKYLLYFVSVMMCIVLLSTVVSSYSYKLLTSIIKMSYLRVLLYSIVDMNIIDLTQDSDCESEDVDYDAGVSEESSNADVTSSSEDALTGDDSSR